MDWWLFEWTTVELVYITDLGEARITVSGMIGNDEELNMLDPDKAKIMLGVFLVVDDNKKAKIQHIRSVAEK